MHHIQRHVNNATTVINYCQISYNIISAVAYVRPTQPTDRVSKISRYRLYGPHTYWWSDGRSLCETACTCAAASVHFDRFIMNITQLMANEACFMRCKLLNLFVYIDIIFQYINSCNKYIHFLRLTA